VWLSLQGLDYIYLFYRKEADLVMREFRSAAASSDGSMDRGGGKRGMGKVRYRHTTDALAVSGLTISICGNFTNESIQKLHRFHLRGQVNGIDRLDVVLRRLGVDDEDVGK
jgi:hypothetical protein